MGKEEQQCAAVAKLTEATRAGSQAVTASSLLLGTDLANHIGLSRWIFLYRKEQSRQERMELSLS